MKRALLVFGSLVLIAILGTGAWYYRFIYCYEKWFENNLVSTVWTSTKQQEMEEIFNQPFTYCGEGSTSRAYASADQRFVIKTFFKSRFISQLPQSLPVLSNLANRRKELRVKYNRIFGSINASYFIPKESGMIYYQFIRPTERFDHSVQLTEKDGSITWLDLNLAEYIVQKKALIVSDYFLTHMAAGEVEKVKSGIVKLLSITKNLYDQGIVLVVLQFLDNFGFVGDEPIRIDVEHVRFDPMWKKKGRAHLAKEIAQFRNWVEIYIPELLPFFNEQVSQLWRDL